MVIAAPTEPYYLEISPDMVEHPQPRLEIREFVKEPIRLSLFIRALQNVMDRDWKRPDSWFAICAMHASPIEYDDVMPFKGKFLGYCQHGRQHFPAWHRAQIMLLEQVIRQEMIEVATDVYGDLGFFEAWGQTFRWPFWDWALPEPEGDDHVPRILTSPTVQILTPTLEPQDVANPMTGYTFPPEALALIEKQGGTPHPLNFRSTQRYPNAGNIYRTDKNEALSEPEDVERQKAGEVLFIRTKDAKPKSPHQALNDSLKADLGTRRSDVVLLLASKKPYWAFSNHTADDNHEGTNISIEGIHDGLHVAIGGDYGSMGDLAWASFDPAFFMHHTNIDRLFALWEAIHLADFKKGVREGIKEAGSIGGGAEGGLYKDGEFMEDDTVDVEDAMYPFRIRETDYTRIKGEEKGPSKHGFWEPCHLLFNYFADPKQSTRPLGFYYPDLEDTDFQPKALRDALIAKYNDHKDKPRYVLVLHKIDASKVTGSVNIEVSIVFRKQDGTPIPEHLTKPILAGTISIFQRVDDSTCANCQTVSQYREGSVDITKALDGIGMTLFVVGCKMEILTVIKPVTEHQQASDQPAAASMFGTDSSDISLLTFVNGKVVKKGIWDPLSGEVMAEELDVFASEEACPPEEAAADDAEVAPVDGAPPA